MSIEGANAWRAERRLEQEQKAKQLQDALESASTPEDRYAAAQAIYGPSVFKQHAENLFGRLIGRTPQPIVNPAAPPSVTTMQGGITPSDAADLSGVSNAGQPAPTKAAPGIGDDSQLPALPAPMPNGGIGARPVTVTGPTPQNRANALAGVLARGTTPEQRQLALERGTLAAQNEAQISGLTGKEAAFERLSAGKTPAEQMRLARLFGMQPQQTMREYTLPDGTRQWMYPYEADAQGLTATMGSGVPKISDFTDSKGNIYHGTEQDGVFKNAAGQVIPDAKPYTKPGSVQPKAGTAGGKNAYATLTKDGWRDTNAPFSILPDFKPMQTFAQTGLYGLEPYQNPDGTIGSALMNKRNGQFKVLSSTTGAPIDPRLLAMATKNMEPALEADTRFRVMSDSYKELQANPHNQQAMLNMVANHIGMTLGLQKGARISQAVWNEAIASAPWLQAFGAKFDSDGYLSGVTITSEQAKQMLDLGQTRRLRQWQQAQQAGQLVGVNVPIPDDLENPSATLQAPKSTAPAPKSANAPAKVKKIKIGDKFYTYNGTGNTADLKNYTEVPK